MKTIIFITLFLVSKGFASDEIKNNPYFTFIQSSQIEFETNNKNFFDMVLVIDKNSKWNELAINTHLTKTKKSLSLCSTQIKKLEIITVDLPKKTIDQLQVENPYLGPPELKIVKEGIPKNVIIGFMLRKISNRGKAFAINHTSVLRSEQTPSLPSFRPLLHTFWISDNHISHTNTPNADITYSTLAHELVHLLGDLGHIENNLEPNLMGSSDVVGKSYFLNVEQCDQIKLFPFMY